jgi:hypothetical protein
MALGCRYGQLGIATPGRLHVSTPHEIGTLASKGICALACGSTMSLGMTNLGMVWAWGWGPHGQLGLGPAAVSTSIPREVEALRGQMVHYITACASHAAALCGANGDQLWMWGRNSQAELGLGTTSDLFEPTRHMLFRTLQVRRVAVSGQASGISVLLTRSMEIDASSGRRGSLPSFNLQQLNPSSQEPHADPNAPAMPTTAGVADLMTRLSADARHKQEATATAVARVIAELKRDDRYEDEMHEITAGAADVVTRSAAVRLTNMQRARGMPCRRVCARAGVFSGVLGRACERSCMCRRLHRKGILAHA